MRRYLRKFGDIKKKNFCTIFGNNYQRIVKIYGEIVKNFGKILEEFRKIFKMWKTLEEILEKF